MIAMDYCELNLNAEMQSRRRAGPASPFLTAFVTSRPGFGLASYSSLADLSAGQLQLSGWPFRLVSYSSLAGLSGWSVTALWLAFPAGQLQLSGWPFRLVIYSSLAGLSGWSVTALAFPAGQLQFSGWPFRLVGYSFLAWPVTLLWLSS